jgi:glycosyltransferase involved in cell wall biosynthesis
MAMLQDTYLQVVLRLASGVIAATDRWLQFFRGVEATVIPVGSNLPIDSRRQDRLASAPVRIGIFSSPGRDHLNNLAVAACRAAAEATPVDALVIGPSIGNGLASTGYLSENGLADAIGSRDLMLLPYSDGVSGRRTTFFGALHVGCAVLTTLVSPMTDFSIDEGAFAYTAPDDSAEFVTRAVGISKDPNYAAELGRRGHALFQRELSGVSLIDRVLAVYLSAQQKHR